MGTQLRKIETALVQLMDIYQVPHAKVDFTVDVQAGEAVISMLTNGLLPAQQIRLKEMLQIARIPELLEGTNKIRVPLDGDLFDNLNYALRTKPLPLPRDKLADIASLPSTAVRAAG